jgi:phospholipid N-methyltransferase
MRIKTVNIDADVETVLRAAKLEGNNLTLQGQLERSMYQKVMKVLEHIGFKWNKGQKCHIGEGDSADRLREALGAGKVVDEKKTFQFFATPKQLAARMASLADIKADDNVLEPSAGDGAIVRAIQEASRINTVFTVEMNPRMAQELRLLGEASRQSGRGNVVVNEEDFLKFRGFFFDKIVMNPPFTNNQDIEHVRHAYDLLEVGGTVVAITSKSWTFGSQKKQLAFKAWYEALVEDGLATMEELPEGTFKESGTDIGTLLLILRRPLAVAKEA